MPLRWPMARAPVERPTAAAIRALADGEGRLALRVTPGARNEALMISEGSLLAKVRAKPKDGKATAAVLALLAEALDSPASQIHLLRGATSREKLVRIPAAASES